MLRTEVACQSPPRGELMPRALSASAICRSDVAPAFRISRMSGSTFAARWSACAVISATAFWRACSMCGLPSTVPRALAAARASVVRLLIRARSFCARAANKCRMNVNNVEVWRRKRLRARWIGESFYPTPTSFAVEAGTLGISRRIVAIPRNFKLGETWVFIAHPKVKEVVDATTGDVEWMGGVFRIFRPTRIEKIVKQSEFEDEKAMAKLREQGITPVPVPDSDRDHQGTVWDKDEEGPQHDIFNTSSEKRWSETEVS
jgi:hypothetical protein